MEEHFRQTGTRECLYTIRPSVSSVLEQADAQGVGPHSTPSSNPHRHQGTA
jgi:hypothetical protein